MRLKNKVKTILGMIHARIFGIKTGSNIYIGKGCSLKGKQRIILGDYVTIRPYTQIWSGGGTIEIGKGTEIGERCRFSIANSLEIGEKVLLSPNVYITDCDHDYRDINRPIIDQGIVQNGQRVSIGDGSYIGINSVIVGNVKIGKHCVIGANLVVTKDVQDYCVVAGIPAKVLRRYDSEPQQWLLVK